MVDDEGSFKEKIRNSFSKVKEDIDNLSKSFKNAEIDLKNQKESLSTLNSNFEEIKGDLRQIKDILGSFKESSIGNNGVGAQWRTMAHNAQQRTMADDGAHKIEKQPKMPLDLSSLEKHTLTLTDREFSVLIAIYELGKEHGNATYAMLSKHLNLTDSPIRHAVNKLIDKQMPLEKERILNGKVSLFIKEGVLSPSLISRLITIRQQYPDEQTTLTT